MAREWRKVARLVQVVKCCRGQIVSKKLRSALVELWGVPPVYSHLAMIHTQLLLAPWKTGTSLGLWVPIYFLKLWGLCSLCPMSSWSNSQWVSEMPRNMRDITHCFLKYSRCMNGSTSVESGLFCVLQSLKFWLKDLLMFYAGETTLWWD